MPPVASRAVVSFPVCRTRETSRDAGVKAPKRNGLRAVRLPRGVPAASLKLSHRAARVAFRPAVFGGEYPRPRPTEAAPSGRGARRLDRDLRGGTGRQGAALRRGGRRGGHCVSHSCPSTARSRRGLAASHSAIDLTASGDRRQRRPVRWRQETLRVLTAPLHAGCDLQLLARSPSEAPTLSQPDHCRPTLRTTHAHRQRRSQ